MVNSARDKRCFDRLREQVRDRDLGRQRHTLDRYASLCAAQATIFILGHGIDDVITMPRDLDANVAVRRGHRHDLAGQHVACDIVDARADRGRIAKDDLEQRMQPRALGRSICSSVPGRCFFIWTGSSVTSSAPASSKRATAAHSVAGSCRRCWLRSPWPRRGHSSEGTVSVSSHKKPRKTFGKSRSFVPAPYPVRNTVMLGSGPKRAPAWSRWPRRSAWSARLWPRWRRPARACSQSGGGWRRDGIQPVRHLDHARAQIQRRRKHTRNTELFDARWPRSTMSTMASTAPTSWKVHLLERDAMHGASASPSR